MQLIDPNHTDFDQVRRQFEWAVPDRYNMAWEVCDKHTRLAQNPALYDARSNGDARVYTFGELRTLSNRLANGLAGIGVTKGDRVGVVLPQRVETGVAHIAVHKLGAVSLPLSVLFGPEAVEHRLRACVPDR